MAWNIVYLSKCSLWTWEECVFYYYWMEYPEYSLEKLMLKLKLQYFGHLMERADSLEKTYAGKDWRQEEKGMTEDEMVGWHHWLNGHEFEQPLGDGEEQGSLACFSPWGQKKSETTEQLNNTTFHESTLYSNARPQMFQATTCQRKHSPEVFPPLGHWLHSTNIFWALKC